tara:strand:+ start:1397 stop:2011 length:615 start_codon:yes stop_codon:yes gene_type:complete
METNIDDNFIGTFDNYYDEELLNRYINHFDQMTSLGLSNDRGNIPSTEIKDNSIDLISSNFWGVSKNELDVSYLSGPFLDIFFQKIYPQYVKKFDYINKLEKHTIYEIKIQKTSPKEGYHSWHSETGGPHNRNRLLAFTLYLNDVEEGGETEFLYQSIRIKPKKNRLIIWPAAFTHVHRGNPPLSKEKYIITGWVEYGEYVKTQ